MEVFICLPRNELFEFIEEMSAFMVYLLTDISINTSTV
jgi:hypothetical protein